MEYTLTFKFNKTNTKIKSKYITTKNNTYTFKSKNEIIELLSEFLYYNVNHK